MVERMSSLERKLDRSRCMGFVTNVNTDMPPGLGWFLSIILLICGALYLPKLHSKAMGSCMTVQRDGVPRSLLFPEDDSKYDALVQWSTLPDTNLDLGYICPHKGGDTETREIQETTIDQKLQTPVATEGSTADTMSSPIKSSISITCAKPTDFGIRSTERSCLYSVVVGLLFILAVGYFFPQSTSAIGNKGASLFTSKPPLAPTPIAEHHNKVKQQKGLNRMILSINKGLQKGRHILQWFRLDLPVDEIDVKPLVNQNANPICRVPFGYLLERECRTTSIANTEAFVHSLA